MSRPIETLRSAWISYLRVSTAEQADRELSISAQRRAAQEHASRHGASILREYVEAGASGMNSHRPVFRQMLEDTLRPNSDVAVIVVHHTSRFTRDSTEARVVKAKLHRLGVRVVSTCQEITDDPMGNLIEGLFECIDQYESDAQRDPDVFRYRRSCAAGVLSWFEVPLWIPNACRRVSTGRRSPCVGT
jgi:site-specific DNA recombinase